VQSEFQVTVRREDATALVQVSGELDLASGPALDAELEGFAGPDTTLVVVDLRELEFMDSTGLSILVRAHRRLAAEGCELSLVQGPPQVQRLLNLTGVGERLRIAATPDELLSGR
jgi:anti-sigma B factor antagonist